MLQLLCTPHHTRRWLRLRRQRSRRRRRRRRHPRRSAERVLATRARLMRSHTRVTAHSQPHNRARVTSYARRCLHICVYAIKIVLYRRGTVVVDDGLSVIYGIDRVPSSRVVGVTAVLLAATHTHCDRRQSLLTRSRDILQFVVAVVVVVDRRDRGCVCHALGVVNTTPVAALSVCVWVHCEEK